MYLNKCIEGAANSNDAKTHLANLSRSIHVFNDKISNFEEYLTADFSISSEICDIINSVDIISKFTGSNVRTNIDTRENESDRISIQLIKEQMNIFSKAVLYSLLMLHNAKTDTERSELLRREIQSIQMYCNKALSLPIIYFKINSYSSELIELRTSRLITLNQ